MRRLDPARRFNDPRIGVGLVVAVRDRLELIVVAMDAHAVGASLGGPGLPGGCRDAGFERTLTHAAEMCRQAKKARSLIKVNAGA
jgi:hypothetical protein